MPLARQCSLEALKKNIAELIASGYEPKQATAIAYSVLRKACGGELPEGARSLTEAETFAAREPDPLPVEAIKFFEKKKVRPGFSYTAVWQEEHNFAFTVAKMMEPRLLKDVHDSLTSALTNGTPFKAWAKDIKSTFDKSGWSQYGTEANEAYRLKRIYDTNTRMARATGQWERIQRTKQFLPNLQYVLGPSKDHRKEHEAWEGLILPADDPWWDEHMPPNGFGCKCGVIAMTETATERAGGLDEAPPIEYEEYNDPQTGDVLLSPKGVQPAFAYNPGQVEEREKQLMQASEDPVSFEKAPDEGPNSKLGKPGTASREFRELILKGTMTDAEIFRAVQAKFGLDDKKASYVAWYRNELRKKGLLPGTTGPTTKTEPTVPKPIDLKPAPVVEATPAGVVEPPTAGPRPRAEDGDLLNPAKPAGAPKLGDAVPAKYWSSDTAPVAKFSAKNLLKALQDINPGKSAKSKAMTAARRELNQLLAQYGMVSTDIMHGHEYDSSVLVKAKQMKKANGYHYSLGKIEIAPQIFDAAVRALERITAYGTKVGELATNSADVRDEVMALKTLVHEAIHGHSPRLPTLYNTDINVKVLEEATTELAAGKVVADLVGGTGGQFTKSYLAYRDTLLSVSVAHLPEGTTDKHKEMLRHASIEMRKTTQQFSSGDAFTAYFASRLPGKTGDAIRAAMEQAAQRYDQQPAEAVSAETRKQRRDLAVEQAMVAAAKPFIDDFNTEVKRVGYKY